MQTQREVNGEEAIDQKKQSSQTNSPRTEVKCILIPISIHISAKLTQHWMLTKNVAWEVHVI